MLNNLSGEEVNLELSAPNRAGIIRPSEPEEPGEDADAGYAVMLNN